MQFVNATDETIVLEPGEGVDGSTFVRRIEGDPFRLTLNSFDEVVDADDLVSSREVLDRRGGGL